jgi:hypothetical protein
MEKLLTPSQLLAISREAEINFEYYHNGYCIDGNATETSIKTISKNKHLIFIEGNEHTGFNHLIDRHSYFSYENYWIVSQSAPGGYKLDNPSKFSSEMVPMIDYIKIAEAVFCEQNKNVTKNSRPELFDKYTGNYFSDVQEEKYHLLTYKDTRIVHTFFPDKKKHNKKMKCAYGKGIVTTKLKFPDGTNDLLVPYENKEGVMVFSILVRKDYLEKMERLLIQKHNASGDVESQYLLASRTFSHFEKFDKETMHYFQNGDLSELEAIINDLDKA